MHDEVMQRETIKGLVSVVIPTRNRPDFLLQCIESVLAQTYSNIEVIVVDDDSDSPVEPIIARHFKNPIQVIRHDASLGAPESRNVGSRAAVGEFLAFLDDDDLWSPKKIQIQIEAFKSVETEVGVVYCGCELIVDGRIIKRPLPKGSSSDFRIRALKKCPINSPTPLIRRQLFEKVGGFDTDLQACQDWDLWIRLSQVCKFHGVKENLAFYRVHGEQISSCLEKKIDSRKALLEKHFLAFSAFPHTLSSHYRRLGALCALASRNSEANTYFLSSVKYSKANWGSWVHLLLHWSCRPFNRYVIRKRGVKKQGGVEIFD